MKWCVFSLLCSLPITCSYCIILYLITYFTDAVILCIFIYEFKHLFFFFLNWSLCTLDIKWSHEWNSNFLWLIAGCWYGNSGGCYLRLGEVSYVKRGIGGNTFIYDYNCIKKIVIQTDGKPKNVLIIKTNKSIIHQQSIQ